MARFRAFAVTCLAAGLLCGVLGGCRDTTPPEPYDYDLGEGNTPLLAGFSVRHNRAILDGKADWKPYRQADLDAETDPDDAADGAAGEENAEGEAELRDLVEEYNGMVADGDVDGLLDFFVEDQHEALRPLLTVSLDLNAKLKGIRKGLDERLPDEGERIEAAFSALLARHTPAMAISDISFAGGDEATAVLTSGMPSASCRFVVEDDDWYLELSDLGEADKSATDEISASYDGWASSLSSGDGAPEKVLEALEAAAKGKEDGGTADEADSGAGEPDSDGDSVKADGEPGEGDD